MLSCGNVHLISDILSSRLRRTLLIGIKISQPRGLNKHHWHCANMTGLQTNWYCGLINMFIIPGNDSCNHIYLNKNINIFWQMSEVYNLVEQFEIILDHFRSYLHIIFSAGFLMYFLSCVCCQIAKVDYWKSFPIDKMRNKLGNLVRHTKNVLKHQHWLRNSIFLEKHLKRFQKRSTHWLW